MTGCITRRWNVIYVVQANTGSFTQACGGGCANVLKCCDCGLVRLDKFVTDEDDSFYEKSGMWQSNDMDSGVRQARIAAEADDVRRAKFVRNYVRNNSVIDFGCGSGGFLHNIMDIASSVAGIELEREKREFLKNEGITCYESIDVLPDEKFDVITLFHVLEHLPDPVAILDKLKSHLNDGGKIIIETPNADDALLSLYDSEEFADFTYWICHLYLYSNKTFSDLMEKCGLKKSLMQQIQRYPLANHLYWLSKKKPGGHVKWAAFNHDMLDGLYGERLAALGIADTIMAVVEKC